MMGTKRSIAERKADLERKLKEQIAALAEQEKQQKELDAIDVQIADLRAKRAGLMDQIDALVALKEQIRPPRVRSKPVGTAPAAPKQKRTKKANTQKPAATA